MLRQSNEPNHKKSIAFLILLVIGMMIPPVELLPNAHASTIIEDLTNGFCTFEIFAGQNVTCNGNNDTVTFTHGSGITITAFPSNKTIFFNATGGGSNGTGETTTVNNLAGTLNWFSSLVGSQINLRGLDLGKGLTGSQTTNTVTLATNFGINSQMCPAGYAFTAFNNSTGIATCTFFSSGSSGGENNTVTNIGVGAGQITSTSPTQVGGNINLRSIANGTGIIISQNSTTILVKTNFYVASKTCSGTDKIYSIDTSTGIILCSVDNTGITSAFGHNNGNGDQIYTGNTGSQQLNFNTMRGGRGITTSANSTDEIISINFKNNNISCNTGFALTSTDNSTGSYTCSPFVTVDTNTAQIGTVGGGTSLFASRVNATQNNLKSLTSTQGISITNSSTLVTINTNFKVNNITCSANNYLSAYNNSTGVYTCTVLPVTSAITTINGNGNSAQTIQGTSGHISATSGGGTTTIDTLFKVNNITCGAGTFISSYSNSTGQYTCSAPSGSGIVSINSDTTSAQTIQGVSGNTTVSTSSGTTTVNTGSNVVIINGQPQTIGKSITFSAQPTFSAGFSLGSNIQLNGFAFLNGGHVYQLPSGSGVILLHNGTMSGGRVTGSTVDSDTIISPTMASALDMAGNQINNVAQPSVGTDAFPANRLGLLGHLATHTCADTNSIKYQSSNQTWICGTSSGIASINSDTTSAQTIQGVSGNTTVSTSSGTTTINTGSNVVTTGGSAQRISKQLTLQDPLLNGVDLAYVAKTSAYTATSQDVVISVNTTSAGTNPTILTLPSASSNTNGTLVIKRIDFGKNVLMIKPQAGQTIDGFANYNITSAKESMTIISDGSNWQSMNFETDSMYNFRLLGNGGVRWYGSAINAYTPSTIAPTTTTIDAQPLIVAKSLRIDKIQLEVSTLVAGSTCRMGIYNDNGTTYPSTLVAGSDVGTVSGASTGVKTNTFTSQIVLQKGLYWLADQCSTATTILLRGVPTTAEPNILGVVSTMGTTATGTGWTATNTFGAFPQSFPTAGATVSTSVQPEILIHPTG